MNLILFELCPDMSCYHKDCKIIIFKSTYKYNTKKLMSLVQSTDAVYCNFIIDDNKTTDH